jgi:hypothetical protein
MGAKSETAMSLGGHFGLCSANACQKNGTGLLLPGVMYQHEDPGTGGLEYLLPALGWIMVEFFLG